MNANDKVHIGDIIYNIQRDFKSGSILFLCLVTSKPPPSYQAVANPEKCRAAGGTKPNTMSLGSTPAAHYFALGVVTLHPNLAVDDIEMEDGIKGINVVVPTYG
jgi:hypothetical protein